MTDGLEVLLQCMLKSPVMMNECGTVAVMARKEVNSSRKTDTGFA